MEKSNSLYKAVALLLVVFIIGSGIVFYLCNKEIRKGYLASEGDAAENFAVLTASNIHLTDAQVKKLKNYSYSELMTSVENEELKDMMSNDSFATKVDYAYLMVHLPDEEVKYVVDESNVSKFDTALGTKLDIMWLLDVTVSDEATNDDMNNAESELTRYSYYIDEDDKIFSDKPTYIYNSSEWGDHICGYAPIYSEEGTYIGAIGVELKTGNYEDYCKAALFTLGALIIVTLLMLTFVFIYIYKQNKKNQYDKIYTDALTQVGNRSYYNDRFIKYFNNQGRKKKIFALMIADIDLFKKVNDTFGHEIGDRILIEFGEILLSTFGKNNVVRFGGEEFVAGMWIDSEDEVEKVIEKFFTAVRNHKFSNQEIDVTISAGCSYSETEKLDGWLMSGLLRASDVGLYWCKENGRNKYKLDKFDPSKTYEKVK